MSVITSADAYLDSAKNHVNDAILSLNKIVIDRVWGVEDFNQSYMEAITETMFELLKLQRKLGRLE
jgi:hypothetical protein